VKNQMANIEENKLRESEEEEEDIMYGAPDDKVWTDKSYAQVESEKLGAAVENHLVSSLHESLRVCLSHKSLFTVRNGSTFNFSQNSPLTVRSSAIKRGRN